MKLLYLFYNSTYIEQRVDLPFYLNIPILICLYLAPSLSVRALHSVEVRERKSEKEKEMEREMESEKEWEREKQIERDK